MDPGAWKSRRQSDARMRSLAITIEHYEARAARPQVPATGWRRSPPPVRDAPACGRARHTTAKCTNGWECRRHGRQVTLPRSVRSCPHPEICKAASACQVEQCHLAFLHTALEVGHDEGKLVFVHILHVQLYLRAGDLEAQMKPDVAWDINRSGETGPVEHLPVGLVLSTGEYCIASRRPDLCWRR
jgi:hypothetical protein